MNVLVVGGAGYIGSHCVRQLVEAGHRTVVLDNLIFGHRAAVDDRAILHIGDLGNIGLVTDLLRREAIEMVMHFAAFTYVGESVQEPLKYYENNVAKPVALVQAMRLAGVRKIVFSSTCATYGIPEKMPLTEDTPQRPVNPYGQTKLDFENCLRACAKAYGISAAALRYFNASGAAANGQIGEDHDPETHLIPLAIWAAMGLRDKLTVFGDDYPTPDGTCLRDYIHVDDLVRAHLDVFSKLEPPGAFVAYNLGTGVPASVMEVIRAVEKVTKKPVPFVVGARREGDPPALYADSSKAQRELNWQPRFTKIEDIVASAWEWHRARPHGYRA